MAKKITAWLCILLLLMTYALPVAVFAAEPETSDSSESSEDDSGLWDTVTGFFGNATDFFDSLLSGIGNLGQSIVNAVIDTLSTGANQYTAAMVAYLLASGGSTLATDEMSNYINEIYRTVFPFGLLILVISWASGVASSGFMLTLDLHSKQSLLRALMQLLVGITCLRYAPSLMVLIFRMSVSMCKVVGKDMIQHCLNSLFGMIGNTIIFSILAMTIILNFAKICMYQCISPLFVGAAAGGEQWRRIAISFLKEYLACCLVPFVTLIYFFLCSVGFAFNTVGVIGAIIIAFSVFSIGRKTLDKLLPV